MTEPFSMPIHTEKDYTPLDADRFFDEPLPLPPSFEEPEQNSETIAEQSSASAQHAVRHPSADDTSHSDDRNMYNRTRIDSREAQTDIREYTHTEQNSDRFHSALYRTPGGDSLPRASPFPRAEHADQEVHIPEPRDFTLLAEALHAPSQAKQRERRGFDSTEAESKQSERSQSPASQAYSYVSRFDTRKRSQSDDTEHEQGGRDFHETSQAEKQESTITAQYDTPTSQPSQQSLSLPPQTDGFALPPNTEDQHDNPTENGSQPHSPTISAIPPTPWNSQSSKEHNSTIQESQQTPTIDWHSRLSSAKLALREKKSRLTALRREAQSTRAASKKLQAEHTKLREKHAKAIEALAEELHEARARFTDAEQRKNVFERRQANLQANYDKLYAKAQQMQQREKAMDEEAKNAVEERERAGESICERLEAAQKALQIEKANMRQTAEELSAALATSVRTPLEDLTRTMAAEISNGLESTFYTESHAKVSEATEKANSSDTAVLEALEGFLTETIEHASKYNEECAEMLQAVADDGAVVIRELNEKQAKLQGMRERIDFLANLFGPAE